MRRRVENIFTVPRNLLGLAMLLAAALMLYESRGQTFYADEWALYANYEGFDPSILLTPDSGNLLLVPVLIYKGLIAAFGGEHYLQFRVFWVFSNLLATGLFFTLARQRADEWLALAASVLLLVFGVSWEIFGGPLGSTILFTVACGLGVLLALERADLRGDALACLLLLVSVSSYSAGLTFVFGAVVQLLVADHRRAWRRAWVIAIPVVLYGAWRVWAIKFHDTSVTGATILAAPSSVAASAAAAAAAISGSFRTPGQNGIATGAGFRTEYGWALILFTAGLVGARLKLRPDLRVNRRLIVVGAMLLTYWVLIAINLSPARAPEASRYQYLGAILIALAAMELTAGLRLGRWTRWTLAGLFGLALLAQLGSLHQATKFERENSELNRAELAAVDLIGHGAPRLALIEPLDDAPVDTDLAIFVGPYLEAAAAHGTPAYSLEELQQRPELSRERADQVLAHLAIRGPDSRAGPDAVKTRLKLDSVTDARVEDGPPGCRRVVPLLDSGRASFTLPAAGFLVRPAPGSHPALSLRRFADEFATPVADPLPGKWSAVDPGPDDSSPIPWRAQITSGSPALLCAAGP